jgi:hypothetical protein
MQDIDRFNALHQQDGCMQIAVPTIIDGGYIKAGLCRYRPTYRYRVYIYIHRYIFKLRYMGPSRGVWAWRHALARDPSATSGRVTRHRTPLFSKGCAQL